LLVVLLGLGGLGLGTTFSSILAHLTAAATPRYAPDISGIFTTTLQVAGAVGVATFGTVYLDLVGHTDPTRAFAVVTAAFAAVALVAAAAGHRATHTSNEGKPPQAWNAASRSASAASSRRAPASSRPKGSSFTFPAS
jgi:hypothetical protein